MSPLTPIAQQVCEKRYFQKDKDGKIIENWHDLVFRVTNHVCKDEDDDSYESSRVDALIVNRGGIFGLYSLREVDQYSRFWAVGSGAEFALGAMKVAYDLFDDAESIARAGIESGTCFDSSSSMPMTSYSLAVS